MPQIYFTIEMFTLRNKKHLVLFLQTFLVKYFSSFQVYIKIKKIVLLGERGTKMFALNEKEADQQGKCSPV